MNGSVTRDVREHATEIIDGIYLEGNIDLVFFGQLLAYVSVESDWDDEGRVFNKTEDQRMADAMTLVEFLVSTGDFWIGRNEGNRDGIFDIVIFEGTECLRDYVNSQFANGGIDDVDLLFASWIRKKLPGRQPPPVPGYVVDLFRDPRS